TVTNCTFSNNEGDGIFIFGGDVTLYNTIVAGNSSSLDDQTPDDIDGTLDVGLPSGQTPSSNNLIGSGGSGGLTNNYTAASGTGNIVLPPSASLAFLGPLQNYGGP